MKCPSCSSTCSDLRDICPKCYLDLRPIKKELQITITHPDESYESLRARITAASERPGVLASLSSLLRGTDNPNLQPPEKTEASPQRELEHNSSKESNQSREEVAEPIPNVLQGMLGHAHHRAPTPPRIESPRYVAEGGAAIDERLFDEAAEELARLELESLELTSDTLHQISNRDEIQLLFELSDEALVNPQGEARYTDEVFTKPISELGSELFERELAKIEGALQPELIPLAAFQRNQAGTGARSSRSLPNAPTPPSQVRILAAWATDSVIAGAGAALLALLLLWNDSPNILASFLASPLSYPWALADFISYLFIALFIVGIAHPLSAACVGGSSLGMRLAGLHYCLATGERPSREALLLRAGMAPLSLLCGAPILQLLNRRGVAEVHSSLFISSSPGSSPNS